jgi:4-aminobutyrate aminotransferase-like enzyme/Ser/Thr protein kinase RdoA (MazF antagonist)
VSHGELLESPIPRWEIAEVAATLARVFDLEGDLTPLPSERDQNLRLDAPDGGFVVRIANSADDLAVLDMQQAALEHIARFPGGPPVPEPRRTADGRRVAEVEGHGVVVSTLLAGEMLREAPGAVGVFDVGAAIGGLQRSLQGFFHPAAGRTLLWDARNVAQLEPMLSAIEDSELRRNVANVVDRVGREVVPILDGLPAQVIHNDINPDNLLVSGSTLSGIVDFGDMVHGPRVMDVAVTASYLIAGAADPVVVMGDLCRGVQTTTVTVAAEELEVLPDLVAARLCQSIAIGAWRVTRHPGNAEYILGDAEPARDALHSLMALDRTELLDRLFIAAGVPVARVPTPTAEVVATRRRVLAPGLRLSYEAPLHLVSGDGVWLRDAAGQRYLDAYNNVVQVGHGHPLIAQTLASQTRRLNTNTRYLTDEVVAYATRLTTLLPNGLDVCYFTNSGSEANDLAWRIARTLTGNDGVVVTEHAYHGSTTAVMAMSPEELPPDQREPWVATVPPPGDHDAVAAIDELGRAPAALIFDTIFSSDGIFDPPGEYLDASAAAIREAGGLYIADEVQAGLGRVGNRMWGFAAGTAIPDIVTLGKPIGNGHPIGAVVTTAEIARRFTDEAYFFSTFGGNTVSAAVGTAVLDITEADGLPERAERVGHYLRAAIRQMPGPVVSVRGAGLFVGVEVADKATAQAIVEGMRERGVLVGTTGPSGNVVKIRPPMVFEERHADFVLRALRQSLG